MSLQLIGTLPISALNIGLVAAIPGLTQQVVDLQTQVSLLVGQFDAQLELSLELPTPQTVAVGLAAQLTALPALLLPSNWLTTGAAINFDLTAQLGLLELQVTALEGLLLGFDAGLSAGSLSYWSYTGPAVGFGEGLALQTAGGYGGVSPDAQINGLVIATENQASWSIFGSSFRIGSSRGVAASGARRLIYEGVFNGGQLNTGVLQVKIPLDLYLGSLQGQAANLAAQIQVSVGVDLPSFSELEASIEAVIPTELLESFFNVKVNLFAEIGALNARIQFLLNLIGDLNASLSAGGLTVWAYSGSAAGFGGALLSAIGAGMPGGSGPDAPIYGLAIATEVPAAWLSFGQIFKTS